MMETWTISGVTLEYDDDEHCYICEGIILPSVTQILQTRFSHKYDHVDRETLQRAAARGTEIHKAVEEYCQGGEIDRKEVRNFKFLCDRYKFTVERNEVPIIIWDEKPIAAGRLDLVINHEGKKALADIKTTSSLDKEYLAYQLNLYRIGYMQSYGGNIDELFGIHLRDDTRKVVPIPIDGRKAWDLLEEFQNGG
jgi:hypothetical protein